MGNNIIVFNPKKDGDFYDFSYTLLVFTNFISIKIAMTQRHCLNFLKEPLNFWQGSTFTSDRTCVRLERSKCYLVSEMVIKFTQRN